MRFFLSISYNGTPFHGWQRQPNASSVQQELEEALSKLFREEVAVTGAGRTDSGVHALNYIAHFDLSETLQPEEFKRVIYKINAILPSQIVVKGVTPVSESAHARFDANERRYRYYLHQVKDPFIDNLSLFHPHPLNIEAMNRASALILGERDFTSMAKLHSNSKTNLCTVTRAEWINYLPNHHTPYSKDISESSIPYGERNHYLYFEIVANRFLRDMVRAVTGTLLIIGQGKEEPEWILEVLERASRGAAGESLPARGLTYMGANYPYPLNFTNGE